MAQLKVLGAPAEVIAAAQAKAQAPARFELFEQNLLVMDVFLAMDTQWRVISGMGAVIQGLDFMALPVVMDGLEVPAADRPAVIRKIKLMERAALCELND